MWLRKNYSNRQTFPASFSASWADAAGTSLDDELDLISSQIEILSLSSLHTIRSPSRIHTKQHSSQIQHCEDAIPPCLSQPPPSRAQPSPHRGPRLPPQVCPCEASSSAVMAYHKRAGLTHHLMSGSSSMLYCIDFVAGLIDATSRSICSQRVRGGAVHRMY